MSSLDLSFAEAVSQYWGILTIPVVAAFIGWFTNWVALQMLFYPVEYRGFGRWLGWQGIIPANAEKVAGTIVRLITQRLVNLGDLFAEFTGETFLEHARDSIESITDMAMREIAERHAPALWAALDDQAKAQVREQVRREVEATAVALLDDLGRNVTSIIDLEQTVLVSMRRDRALLGRIFRTVGSEEFRFIQNSGAYFGFLFGLPLMFTWWAWPSWWQLPVAGFIVGYATNWVALRMIFEPKDPVKIGPFTVQGLFHKRQREVAEVFAMIVAEQVINADNIIAAVTSGPGGDTVREMVRRHIDILVTRHEQHPVVAMALTAAGLDGQKLRVELHARVYEELPRPGGLLYVFADKGVDVRDTLFSRMSVLDARSFEGVLRPAFQQDEWKLIVAGGVLGLLAGWGQAVFVFRDMLLAVASQQIPM